MNLGQLTSKIPYWAYLLVLFVIFINILYLVYKLQRPENGLACKYKDGQIVIDHVIPKSAAEKAGIKPGDILISNKSLINEDWSGVQPVKAGDTITVDILRNGQPMSIQLTHTIRNAKFLWFIFILFVLMCLSAIASLYLIYKKPNDLPVRIFFLCILCFIVCENAIYIVFPEFLASVTVVVFNFCACIIGPVLINFHLLFPRTSILITQFPKLPVIFYLIALILFSIFSIFSILSYYVGTDYFNSMALMLNRIMLYWITLTYFLALCTAIYQFKVIKDTLARNQLLIVIIGSFFGLVAPISFTFFYNSLTQMEQHFPFIWEGLSGIGTLILVVCICIAIFRYRIWDTEIIIRKALLYLGATILITLSYFLLILFVDRFTTIENNFIRFSSLAVSIIIFLIFRDWLQRLIDRLFHREAYDSATVVSDFEERLAGIYNTDELKSRIVLGLDEIFHFKSFVLNLKINGMIYEPAFAIGTNNHKMENEVSISHELEKRLLKSKVFSPGELEQNLTIFEITKSELIVPILKEDQPFGFFLCGQKKSEKSYSMQDIRVLSLTAKRVISLFQTALLYQKDLDRQLAMERERARISQDMHDDVGASLTRISILSDLAKSKIEVKGEAKQWLSQISDTSRDVMEEMSQIIWALNPKNDTLEGLVAYIRRFANEYLEHTDINCVFDLPEILPNKALTVDARRNVYLVVREALHNVVKHAGATKVLISLQINTPGFKVIIKDDGAGFDPGNLKFPGNGLINMNKRMKDIGGSFKISSENGKGTEIKLGI
jgi:signal transduction histidine kinase